MQPYELGNGKYCRDIRCSNLIVCPFYCPASLFVFLSLSLGHFEESSCINATTHRP